MIVGQLPSVQQIYDCSSQELQQLSTTLQKQLENSSQHSTDHATLQDYIETIHTELEQRKTLQFFQQICAIDNPYLKKVTDFNNQFLKLAEVAIAQQQQPPLPSHTLDTEPQSDSASVTSAQPSLISQGSAKTEVPRKTWKGDKKMGIGGSSGSKAKNSMKDFIMSTLNKNKADGCVVVKKGGPPKAQPAYTVNERGHLVNPSTLQPISTKTIKSIPAKQSTVSEKQISEVRKNPREKQLLQKREEVVEKLKGKRPEKKKEKPINNKELVEMIRQEEQKKQEVDKKQKKGQKKECDQSKNQMKQNVQDSKQQNRQNRQGNIIEPEIQGKIQAERQGEQPFPLSRLDEKQIIREEEEKITERGSDQNSDTFGQDKKEETEDRQKTELKPTENPIKTNQQKAFSNEQHVTQQSNSEYPLDSPLPENLPQATFTKTDNHEEVSIRECIESDKNAAKKAEQKISNKQDQKESIEEGQKGSSKTGLELQKDLGKEKDNQIQGKEGSEEVLGLRREESQSGGEHKFKEKQSFPQKQGEREFVSMKMKSEDKENLGKPQKKCYNEEYWIHIREEAQFKIKRFREEKELEELQKNQVKEGIDKSMRGPENGKEGGEGSGGLVDDEVIDEYYEKKKKDLKKVVDFHKKKTVPKRTTIVAPPKPLYVRPDFNYLQVYPTFNHIFSVMYTKSEHQAVQDIPGIMRELTNIFSTHLSHFKEKKSFFQPALFLPFDSGNRLQLSDPRQLLLHTESTYVNLKKMVERLQIFNRNLQGEFEGGDQKYYRVVKSKEEVYDIITSGFLRRKQWKELPHGCSLRSSWNFFWSWSKPDIDMSRLLVWQRINHFPFNKNLSRKDLLYKNLDAFRKMIKMPFPFLPLTFNLPKEYTQFSMKFHEEELLNRDHNFWIMKPIGKSRGRGIKVISNLAELNYTDNIVVQKYIPNPLLLDGYKFDMRIYVLVTSFHPLEAFVYREGFARLSTEKFSLDPAHMKNAFIHLTNFSVNKNNEQAKKTNFSGGSKISLKTLKDRLTKMDHSFSRVWSQVHEIIIKSLLGCSISVPSFPAAFELFGYDIMIDSETNCHLIEINASPSLQRSYLLDEIIKQSLIDDILDIVNPPDFDKEQLLDIMADRLSGKAKITPEEDLVAIARVLKYQRVRQIGQLPEHLGLFQRVAPSQMSTDLQKLIKGRSGTNNPRNID